MAVWSVVFALAQIVAPGLARRDVLTSGPRVFDRLANPLFRMADRLLVEELLSTREVRLPLRSAVRLFVPRRPQQYAASPPPPGADLGLQPAGVMLA